MTLVVDASTVAAALIEDTARGDWALDLLARGGLVAPHLMPAECANVLRRAELAGIIGRDVALLAHADLATLPVDLHPYAPFAERIIALRAAVTTYDGWYVALAEAIDAPLATCDTRLARAPGIRCTVLTPPAERT